MGAQELKKWAVVASVLEDDEEEELLEGVADLMDEMGIEPDEVEGKALPKNVKKALKRYQKMSPQQQKKYTLKKWKDWLKELKRKAKSENEEAADDAKKMYKAAKKMEQAGVGVGTIRSFLNASQKFRKKMIKRVSPERARILRKYQSV